ncbi:SdpI family protein [Umezawaea beigongshangensis]|uniref:SdpI family protein n=1 Tax=Umezawaea beigongshangensis TaxID=2780383 RepID=UPI0027DC2B5D|nr:SdpI family protein [Umezawaea beigongshangensis]
MNLAASDVNAAPLALRIVLLVALGLAGLSLAVIGYLSLRGKLPRNRAVGVRTAATLRDDEAFALGNKVAGVPNLVAGAVGVIGAVAAAALPSTAPVVVAALLSGVGVLVIAGAGGVLGHRAAAAMPEPPKGCASCACAGAGCSPVLTRSS